MIPSWLPLWITLRYQYRHLSVQGWTQISKCLVPFLCRCWYSWSYFPGLWDKKRNKEMGPLLQRTTDPLAQCQKTLHHGKFSYHTFLKIICQYFCMWIIYTQSHQTIGLLKINLLWDYLNTILCIQWLTAHSVCDVLTWVSSAQKAPAQSFSKQLQ